VNVANNRVGRIIGAQGASIKMLEQQSGSRIRIAMGWLPSVGSLKL